jgi:hypothetical protein
MHAISLKTGTSAVRFLGSQRDETGFEFEGAGNLNSIIAPRMWPGGPASSFF